MERDLGKMERDLGKMERDLGKLRNVHVHLQASKNTITVACAA
jgi:hypothetical protein